MRKQYKIEIDPELTQTVFLPFELKNQAPILKIAFGSKMVEVEGLPHPNQKNILVISKDIQDALLFPDLQVPCHLFTEHDTLYIGPLVGIFTSGFVPFQYRPLGDRSAIFAKLLSTAKMVGALPFVFGEQHINWESGQITGYFYHQNEWKKLDTPFPNVVYDRLPNRFSEKRFNLKKIKDRLQKDYLIPWYNPGFFNKLDIYERLYQVDNVAKYLPETLPFQSFSMIEKMLSDYGHVYLKPNNSSFGNGIYQIIFEKDPGFYYCRYRDQKGNNKLIRFKSLESMARHIFSNRNLSNMIVQQGIHLIRIDQHPIDFRIHTNKDDHGDWQVTAIAAKAAGTGGMTTHIQHGGEIKTINEIFPDKHELKRNVNKLQEAVLKMSKALEQQIEGIIAEIGFDIGIDKNGDIWLLEANSKPGRSIFSHPHLRKFEYLSRKLSLAFAVYLTEQAIYNPNRIFN